MTNFDTMFNSVRQDWITPDEIYNPLNDEFHFTLDVCASEDNTRCDKYFCENEDGLKQEWIGTCWMNPPFKNKAQWIKKAYQESVKGVTVVCLIPARTNTNWFHDYCLKYGEVRFIRGRPKFIGAKHGLPQPLAVVIFRPKSVEGQSSTTSRYGAL